jgi:hypothetical protein
VTDEQRKIGKYLSMTLKDVIQACGQERTDVDEFNHGRSLRWTATCFSIISNEIICE